MDLLFAERIGLRHAGVAREPTRQPGQPLAPAQQDDHGVVDPIDRRPGAIQGHPAQHGTTPATGQ